MGRATVATVSGMSGSGKSTTARALAEVLDAALIETDHFHVGTSKLLERHGEINHDMPHTYDYAHAGRAALELTLGQAVTLPRYSYETAERTDQTHALDPTLSRNVVIDGLYAEHAKDVLDQATDVNVLRVLVDTPLYVSIVRRILRDTAIQATDSERAVGFSPEGSLQYVVQTAIPTYLANQDRAAFDFVVR
jgi:uridine kinase